MSLDDLHIENSLFLVCPTDYLDLLITRQFVGKVYFYSALGANFTWDVPTQEYLVSFIKEHLIEQIVFVIRPNNKFLSPTNPNLEVFKWQDHFKITKNKLKQQQLKLLETNFLGSFLEREHINVETLVYDMHPKNNYLLTLKDANALLDKVSLN